MGEYNEAQKLVMDDLVLGMPGVRGDRMFGYPGYKVNGKVFAFVGGSGIAIKLPEARAKQLVESGQGMVYFEPAEGIVWKSWVLIVRPQADEYREDVALFEESVGYVGAG